MRATGVEQGHAAREAPAGLTHTFAQDDVHDFVWTAWNGYAEPLRGRLRRARAARTSTSRCSIRRSTPTSRARRAQGDGRLAAVLLRDARPVPVPARHRRRAAVQRARVGRHGVRDVLHDLRGQWDRSATLTRYVTVHEFGHGYFMGAPGLERVRGAVPRRGDERDLGLADARRTSACSSSRCRARSEWLGVRLPTIAYADFERTARDARGSRPIPSRATRGTASRAGSYGLVYARTSIVFHDLEKRLGGDALRARHEALLPALAPPAPEHGRPARGAGRRERAARRGRRLVRARRSTATPRSTTASSRVESTEVLPEQGRAARTDKRVEKDPDDVEKEIDRGARGLEGAHPGRRARRPFPVPQRGRRAALRRPRAGAAGRHVRRREHGDGSTSRRGAMASLRLRAARRRSTSAQLDPDRDDPARPEQARRRPHARESTATASARWALEASNVVELVLSLLVTQ